MKEKISNNINTLFIEAQKLSCVAVGSVVPTFGRAFAREHMKNPAPQNTAALSKAIESIKRTLAEAPEEKNFLAMRPVVLTLRTGAPCLALLTYDTSVNGTLGNAFGTIRLTRLAEDIARRDWYCYMEDDRFVHGPINVVGPHLAVYSGSETAPEWEGNGFGTALLAQSDFVCRDLIARYHTDHSTLPAIGFISDNAKGKEMPRTKWTSEQTLKIGYIQWHADSFAKQYR